MITQDSLPSFTHLIIIGNGFDLNLGLPTSYNDFFKSSEFQDKLSENKTALISELARIHQIQNWIDLENAIKGIALRYNNREKLKSDFVVLKNTMSAYLTNVFGNYNFDESSRAYNFLNEINMNESIIINFNYSNVVKNILEVKNVEEVDKRIIHIHGDYKENNLILGVEDGTEIREGHEFLLKSTHLNYRGFNLQRLLENADKLSIFGHSLGETDEMYFKDFFKQHSGNSSSEFFDFDLYCYDENSYDSLMARINILTNNSVGRFRQNLNFNPIRLV